MLTKLKMTRKQRHAYTYGEKIFWLCVAAEREQLRPRIERRSDMVWGRAIGAIADQLFDKILDSLGEDYGIRELWGGRIA